MKIETLTNLINGELLNSPYISEVVSFTDRVEDVSRGSCFFAFNKKDIFKAIKKGAYAIVTTQDVEIIDKEIAWIKIGSLNKALFNIFKYENLNETIYLTDKITMMLIKKMSLDKKVVVLEKEEDFFKAINLNEKIIVSDKSFEFPNVKELEEKEINLVQLTLFKSRFNNLEINLPFVYKDSFSKAINFFEEFDIKYTLEFELDRFKPVFIDHLFREVEYGESDKVLITGIKNDEIFFKELNYIIANTKHAKTVFINKDSITYIHEDFNFGVLVDVDIELNKFEEKNLFEEN